MILHSTHIKCLEKHCCWCRKGSGWLGMAHSVCILCCQSPPQEVDPWARMRTCIPVEESESRPSPVCSTHPQPTDHSSTHTHSLFLLFYRKMSPWSRRLMSSAGSWSSPAPKSMTLKQLWNWPRNSDHKMFQRQVMSQWPRGMSIGITGPMVATRRSPFGFQGYVSPESFCIRPHLPHGLTSGIQRTCEALATARQAQDQKPRG